MKPFTPTDIKALCVEYDLTPSKSYGQHYLLSEKVIEEMAAAAEITKDDTVVEIGPGFGILTFALAENAKRVIAFEIEQKLRPYWEKTLKNLKTQRLKDGGEIELVWGNALTTILDFRFQILDSYKVVANLPYQITSQALRLLLEQEQKPERIVVMVQREVADRICAKAGDMSLLGLSVQYYGAPRIVCQVPRGSFWPVPKVDSAVVAIAPNHLITQSPDHPIDAHMFFKIARAGFSHPRKQLWRNVAEGLKLSADSVKQAVFLSSGNEKARAEELGVEEWRHLARQLSPFL